MVEIFNKIGVDESIFYQFVIFLISFIFLKRLFFSKLQEVLDQREEQTTLSDIHSDQMLKKTEELNAKYEQKLQESYDRATDYFEGEKKEILTDVKIFISREEQKIIDQLAIEKEKCQQEIALQTESANKHQQELKQELIDKMVKM